MQDNSAWIWIKYLDNVGISAINRLLNISGDPVQCTRSECFVNFCFFQFQFPGNYNLPCHPPACRQTYFQFQFPRNFATSQKAGSTAVVSSNILLITGWKQRKLAPSAKMYWICVDMHLPTTALWSGLRCVRSSDVLANISQDLKILSASFILLYYPRQDLSQSLHSKRRFYV